MTDPIRALALVSLFILGPHAAHAAFRPIAAVKAESFGGAKALWSPLPVLAELDPAADAMRLQVPPTVIGRPLTARLDFKRLPGYSHWAAQRQAEGGATWTALKTVLDELGDGPAMVLSHEKIPAQGPAVLLLGLRRGSHFQLYASVPGRLGPCGSKLCFEPGEPVFASRSAALAWSLLKPLALREAKNAASR